MIRTLLLAALVALAFSQAALDQKEWYGPRMGSGPFCDSKCIPDRNYRFRRDWLEMPSELTSKYIYFGDGPEEWWINQGCGEAINDFFLSPTTASESFLLGCKPALLYFFELDLDYDHDDGRLVTELYLKGTYAITDDSWSNFITDYFANLVDPDVDVRTGPWTLIRQLPSLDGSTYFGKYDHDVSIKQTFVANYERNFCTFVGSVVPIVERDFCDYTDDYDSDYDSDEIKYVTREFCDYMIGDFGAKRFDLACGGSDDQDVCDDMTVVSDDEDRRNSVNRRNNIRGNVRPMKALNEMILSVRLGGQVVEANEEQKRSISKKMGRDAGQYDYTQQAIPGFGDVNPDSDATFWSTPWEDATFYYVPYTSSITAPYCAFRDH